ncbi:MAG TPA: hypothetical protein VL099_06250 [Candidatus Binatia bacterium]|nr:hypothetical protein [Candidatus Binatia bacterium]
MKKVICLLALSLAALRLAAAGGAAVPAVQVESLTAQIPARPAQALTGSQFAEIILRMDRQQRESAIRDEILKGNLPAFLRQLVPVELQGRLAGGRMVTATIFVAPDYLAIGSDEDFLRIPMNLYTAAAVAGEFGFVLPTRKMVDAIYSQSKFRFTPQPLAPGPQMSSTEYYRRHNQIIEQQARTAGIPLGELVAGDKKDVVISNRLASNPGRIAIYGWQRAEGQPIQPLSTVHGAGYADYSHGIRLISQKVWIEGKLRWMDEVLRDPELSRVLSDEGPIGDRRALASALVPARIHPAGSFPSN